MDMNIKEQMVVINLLWAAKELDAGRALTVEGAAYIAAAEDLLSELETETDRA